MKTHLEIPDEFCVPGTRRARGARRQAQKLHGDGGEVAAVGRVADVLGLRSVGRIVREGCWGRDAGVCVCVFDVPWRTWRGRSAERVVRERRGGEVVAFSYGCTLANMARDDTMRRMPVMRPARTLPSAPACDPCTKSLLHCTRNVYENVSSSGSLLRCVCEEEAGI